MAWTAPMTFADGNALTAAQMNTYLRDNFNETMTAKALNEGSMFFGSDTNELVERQPAVARVGTTESTTSTSYVDLATVGPQVTVETGSAALVFIAGHMGNNTANSQTIMTYSVSGATTIGASANWGILIDGLAAATDSNFWGGQRANLEQGLTPGLNTFKAVYRCGSGTGVWGSRFIAVWPM